MARQARGESVDPRNIQLVHCFNRCVRRAMLCGYDSYSGKDYSHRREWFQQRMKLLAAVFGIDIVTYAIMSNHFHVILRSRPDVVQQWSDEEVARRWWTLHPARKDAEGNAAEPAESDLAPIINDPNRLAEIRRRLSDVSWWMKSLCEPIARRANREDQVTGKFWEARFRAEPILDEASLLACAVYVDLNPVRAAMAQSPEESTFTGARDRIDDLKTGQPAPELASLAQWERDPERVCSGWLAPIELSKDDDLGAAVDRSGRRASRKGWLNISVTDYLEILDWTGRLIRHDKRGAIPASLKPILQRIGLKQSGWRKLITRFGRLYKRVIGLADSIAREAVRRGQSLMHAPALQLFR